MSQLALSLLGSFQATLDGQPISGFRSQKVRGLLAYLAVEGARPHARPALAALLWPDAPGSMALNYLRSALANLRDLLGDAAAPAAGPPFLLVTRETLHLNPAADIRLDVAAFAALRGGGLDHRPDQQALEGALALYRGPFLEGFSGDDSPAFAEWLLITREHYSRMALAALQQLVALAFEGSRYAAAEEYCRRWLALEPWDETAHRQLMAALALAGSRSAALAHYQSWRGLLAQELGVEPAPETAALYERIRSGEVGPGVGITSGAAGAPLLPAPLLAVPGREDLLRFAAREAELAQLDRQLDRMLRGGGQVVFIQGDAGSGKTTLLHAFARRAAQREAGIAIAEGRCSDCGGCGGCGDPYLPFREIIRQLASGQRIAGSAALTGGGATPVQSDLFDQVTLFLQAAARQPPLLLLLDDLQWADRGTISLLFHLSRHLSGSRILLVGAYRPEDVAQHEDRQRSPLTLVVHEVQRTSGDPPIDLNRIDGRAFIDALIDAEPNRLGADFRATLHAHTEGHALFTVELLRAMQERGDLVQDAGGAWIERAAPDWQSLPPRVEAVIAERIERLPRRLRALLEAAGAQGEVFSLEVLALQSHAPPAQLAWWFGELLCRQHGLVRVEAQPAADAANAADAAADGVPSLTRYRFAHSLYQAYLYGRLDPMRRAAAHRGVAEALERLHAAALHAVAVPLAWHFEQAGGAAMHAKAAHYRRLAGDEAMRSSTCEAAIGHYLHALALLAALPPSPARAEEEAALHLALAGPLTIMHGWGGREAQAAIDHAYDLCRVAQDRSRLAETMWTLATTYVGRGEPAAALALGKTLLQMAQQDGDPHALAVAHFSLGEAHFFGGEPLPARRHLERAIALLDPEKPQPAVVTGVDMAVAALNWLAMSLWALGFPQQALAAGRQALARAHSLEQPRTLAFALLTPGAMFDLQRGDLDAAERSAAAAQRICAGYDLAFYRNLADILQGCAAAMGGAPAGLAQAERGLAAWEAPGTAGGTVYCRVLLAAALQKTGRVEAGLAVADDALALVERTGLRYSEAELWRIKGELLQAADPSDPAGAETCLDQAITVARCRQERLWELRATVSLARLWEIQGKGAEAVPRLAAIYGTFDEGHDLPDLQIAAALLAALDHDGG